MSASSNCVTCGIAFQLWTRRRLMVLRSGDIGCRVIAPHFEKSTLSGAGAADGAALAAFSAALIFCKRWIYARRSLSWILALSPLPRTRVRSIPKSRAIFRIDGDAAGIPPAFCGENSPAPPPPRRRVFRCLPRRPLFHPTRGRPPRGGRAPFRGPPQGRLPPPITDLLRGRGCWRQCPTRAREWVRPPFHFPFRRWFGL